LKPNSATLSNEAFAGAAEPDRAVVPDRAASLPVAIALLLLRAYKLLISPIFTGSCRFVPSCSDYAAEAVERFGVLRGTWLAARRLSRCHPFCAGGHDPVPPRR
jgi:putative membrane protein insertion efficiency factor